MRLKSKVIAAILMMSVAMGATAMDEKHALMPVPKSIDWGEGLIIIDGTFSIKLTSFNETRLQNAVYRTYDRISSQTGISFLARDEQTGANVIMEIEVSGAGNDYPAINDDESYILTISDGKINLLANEPVGALRGMETFLQLIERNDSGFVVPNVTINDAPFFPWRGLLVDSCRHWLPKEVIHRTLDAMAASKLNVLHWHLSEDQGFRVESKVYPKLHEMGSDGNYYTQEEIKDVVEHARQLGIRVMPEFDVPGHTTSWLVGYPELAAKEMEYTIARRYGVFHTIMDPTKPETLEFLKNFIAEMVTLFPDQYFHIGGDEVEDTFWKESKAIQAYMKEHGLADSFALQTQFNQKLLPIIESNGKKMIGWDEIFQPNLPRSTVVHSWRGQESLAEAAQKGYMGILSNGYYIDLFYHAEDHYNVHPLTGAAARLTEAEKKRILGGEATMWGELISPEVVDSRIWPRAAAIGERLWSPIEVNDVDDMYRRLVVHSKRLELLGLNHRTFQRLFLERLAGDKDVKPLQILATALEPVKSYRRHVTIRHQSFMPLNKFVDALPPDNMRARAFNQQVKRFVKDKSEVEKIYSYLLELNRNDSAFRKVYGADSMVNDLMPISEALGTLAGYALQSITDLVGREEMSPGSKKAAKKFLAKQEKIKKEWDKHKPIHQTEIACLQGLKMLIEAAVK